MGTSFADLHIFDMTSNTWECLDEDASASGGPGPRYNHRSVLSAWGGLPQMVVTGGFCDDDEGGHPTGGCYALDVSGL